MHALPLDPSPALSNKSGINNLRKHTRGFIAIAMLSVIGLGMHSVQAQDKQKAGKAPRKARQDVVGPAIRENKATPIDRIKVPEGFKVELLYSVPGVEQGSWVNLCVDNKNRLLVSDQYGGLYRITLTAPGQTVTAADVEKVPAEIRAVNGMVWAFDALYVWVN